MNRYPGIQPFERNQSHLFKGREEEKQELLDLIALHPLVVLFAKSGIGKTSLLQAGIAPEMPNEQLLPVFIRLNRTDTDTSPEKQVYQILREQKHLSQETPDNLTLWEYLKKARFVQAGEPCTPVLIFDQFEELFTLYDAEQRERFVAEFADVVNKRMPDSVREWFDRDADSLPPRQVAQYERPLNVKVVLSIRSDMLSFLDQLSRPIPSILRCRYELKSLSRANAEKAIVEPAAAKAKEKGEVKFGTPSFKYNGKALNQILNYLQEGKTNNIESSQLQLLCGNIENIMSDNPIDAADLTVYKSTYGDYEGLKRFVEEFYSDKISELPVERQGIVKKAIEEGLIKSGRRVSLDVVVLNNDYNLKDSDLGELVDKRLLRKDPRQDRIYYEVSHDTLIEPILKSYKIRKEEEEKITERKKRIRYFLFGIFGILASVGAFSVAVWALQQRSNAEEAQQKAQNALIEATKEREKAVNEKERADSLLNIANENLEKYKTQVKQTNKAKREKDQKEIKRILTLANSYITNGGYALALEELEKALKINPSNSDVKKLIQLCKENTNN